MHVPAVIGSSDNYQNYMSWYMHKLNIMSRYLYIIEHENNNLVHSFYFVVRLI